MFKWIGITLCALVGLVCVGELVRRHPELAPTAEEALHLLIAILGLLAVITWINLTDTIQSLRGEIGALRAFLEFIGLEEKDTRSYYMTYGSYQSHLEKIGHAMGISALENFLEFNGLEAEDVARLKSNGFDPERDSDLIEKIQTRREGARSGNYGEDSGVEGLKGRDKADGDDPLR